MILVIFILKQIIKLIINSNGFLDKYQKKVFKKTVIIKKFCNYILLLKMYKENHFVRPLISCKIAPSHN